jgi:hypothetical protein
MFFVERIFDLISVKGFLLLKKLIGKEMESILKRFLISIGIFVGGVEFVFRCMLLNRIRPPRFFINLVDSIQNVILLVLGIGAFCVAVFVLMAVAQSYFESKEKQKQLLKEEEIQKASDKIWERQQKEELRKQRKNDEKDRMRKLELELREQAEIEYRKNRSAKEATKDSLSDFL